jgi:hypothetical protein
VKIHIINHLNGHGEGEWQVWVSLPETESEHVHEAPESFIIGSGTTEMDARMVAINALDNAKDLLMGPWRPAMLKAPLRP